MAELPEAIWILERQSAAVESVRADAAVIWRDENARQARVRFLDPQSAEAQRTLGKLRQQETLNRGAAACRATAEHKRLEAGEQAERVRSLTDVATDENAQAESQLRLANAHLDDALQLAAEARRAVADADAKGSVS